MNLLLHAIISDGLWFLVFVGWVVLIVVGLEADKPLSGGIPGHIDMHEQRMAHAWNLRDKIGEIGGWAVFAGVCALLPVILYWIFTVHGGSRLVNRYRDRHVGVPKSPTWACELNDGD